VEERESLSRFREQDLDDFLRLLLSEEAPDGVLEVRAKTIGINLDERHSVAFLRPAAPPEDERPDVAQENARRLLADGTKEARGLVARLEEGFGVMLPGEPDAAELAAIARSILGESVRPGVGRPGAGIAGLRRSAREALRALRIGTYIRPGAPFHRYADVEVLDIVRIGTPQAEAFMRSVLGPLAPPAPNKIYLDTLREYVLNGSRLKLAAAALSVHPHTLSYRLKQIRQRFGIDLDNPSTRLRVHLALTVLEALTPSD
jgi:sugar diacid utilization regulator